MSDNNTTKSLEDLMEFVKARSPGQDEFHQAVTEVASDVYWVPEW